MSDSNMMSLQAVILDMDGVITQTATLHARAWKLMFDAFLQEKQGENFQPLNIEEDYKKFIDGKPRFDGILSFLKSRNIELQEGNKDDGVDKDSVYGLGFRKNEIFQRLLEKEGVQVYPDTLKMIKKWRKENLKLAVISSSRNCRKIIESAGLTGNFDAMVDGLLLEEENLRGKPEPDIFFKACDLLGVEVNHTMIIEDAISGVQAGKKGKFALVVGVARNGEEKSLKEAGADIVVKELEQIVEKTKQMNKKNNAEDLPNALQEIEKIFEILGKKKPSLFLDYDGTLTPIVPNPDDALLSESTKKIVTELADLIPVGVISGRDRKDIKSKIDIHNLIYAGSHGFDITGPNQLAMQYEQGQKSLPALDEAESHLQEKLKDLKGAQVERKKYAIAVHYRNVADDKVGEVEKAVYEELDQQENLKKGTGKKVLELKPDLDWHKGRALSWLLKELELDEDRYTPIFIGDDVTDEDALETIRESGIGIIVGSHDEKTSATFRLNNTDEVAQFLEQLKNRLKASKV